MANNIGPQELEGLIAQLMSPDNNVRGQAENVYRSWRQAPDALLAAVTQVLMSSTFPEARSMCIILLRTLLTKPAEAIWDSTSPQGKQAVLSNLLVAVVSEPTPTLRHKLSQLVAEVGAKLLSQKLWPELVPFLQVCFESQEENKKRDCSYNLW